MKQPLASMQNTIKSAVVGTIEWLDESKAVRLQVSEDIDRFIKQSRDPQVGLSSLARKTGVHQKTLLRLLQLKNRPGYLTIYKIYRVLLKSQNDSEVYEKAPPIIKSYLKQQNPQKQDRKIEYRVDLCQELLRNRTFCEIYFLAGAGDVTESEILYQYGQLGKQTTDRMLRLGVLIKKSKDVFALGNVQTTLSAEVLKVAAQNLIESYYKPNHADEMGQNFMGIFAESLSESAYSQWLKIDEEAFAKKVKLTEDPKAKGPIRAFTVMTIDQMKIDKEGILK